MIMIKKWSDYSEKYGIGYLLNSNQVGVFFNDLSNIVEINV